MTTEEWNDKPAGGPRMTPTTLAETILRDVPRYTFDTNGELLYEREVLATLTAAMDPALSERAGEVLSRLRKADEYEPLGHDGWDAADLITALMTQNAALRVERDEALEWLSASQGYIADAVFALDKQEKAEAERDALRAERDRYLRHLTAGAESLNAHKARDEAAEAQIAALTARVEGLTGALEHEIKRSRRHLAASTLAALEEARAALSITEATQ